MRKDMGTAIERNEKLAQAIKHVSPQKWFAVDSCNDVEYFDTPKAAEQSAIADPCPCRPQILDELRAENDRLRKALAGLIPWAGQSPTGPPFASAEAKARNREMYEEALSNACACFPDDFNSGRDLSDEERERALKE